MKPQLQQISQSKLAAVFDIYGLDSVDCAVNLIKGENTQTLSDKGKLIASKELLEVIKGK